MRDSKPSSRLQFGSSWMKKRKLVNLKFDEKKPQKSCFVLVLASISKQALDRCLRLDKEPIRIERGQDQVCKDFFGVNMNTTAGGCLTLAIELNESSETRIEQFAYPAVSFALK